MGTNPRAPFPECATYEIEATRLSLQDLSDIFNGRAKSALSSDCKNLGVMVNPCGVDKSGAWTVYVYMAWYQWRMNRGAKRVRFQDYWDMCTPDHLKGPNVVCSIDTADESVRESYLAAIGKTYADFEKVWDDAIEGKKSNYAKVTINV